MRVPFMNEASANTSRAAVQIFVCTPDGEIDVPVVQPDGNVPRRVREIERHYASLGVSGARNRLHVE